MSARFAGLCLGAMVAMSSAPSWAQVQPLAGVSAWVERGFSGGSLRALPMASLEGPRFSLSAAALLAGSERESPYQGGKLAAGMLLDPLPRLPIELRLTAAHRDGAAVPERGLLRADGRLHFQDGRRGAWMGLAAEHDLNVALDSGDWQTPMIGFGAWTRRDRLWLVLDLEQRAGLFATGSTRPDSIPPRRDTQDAGVGVSGERFLRVTLTTTRAAVRYQGQRFELEGVGGVTLSLLREPRRWAQAKATMRLTPDMAVFATAGSRAPELYLIEPSESPRATLGLTLAGWRSADVERPLPARATALRWKLRDLGGGSYAVSVVVPGARLVELMADFTEWQPIRLEPDGSERWETVVAIPPGIHHVNLRVDGGAWLPPPGIPAADDGFGGVSGIVVVE